MDAIQFSYLEAMKDNAAEADVEKSNNGQVPSVLRQHPELLIDMKVRLVSFSLCDTDGELLFDDDEGRAILRQRDPAIIDRLYDVAQRLSGLAAGSLEEEKKASAMMATLASN
jgi:hypothetical protein